MSSEKTNAPAATGANEGDQLTAGSSDTVAQGRATGNYGLVTPLDGALWLIRHGFPVFPCDHPRTPRCTGLHKTCDGSRGKHPAVAFTRAWTFDERRVHETFSRGLRNPAVAVGACSGPDGARIHCLGARLASRSAVRVCCDERRRRSSTASATDMVSRAIDPSRDRSPTHSIASEPHASNSRSWRRF